VNQPMQLGLHWNTTNLSGDDLADRKRKAAVQEQAILALYRQHGQLGPWEVWRLTGEQWPITSIRRAINTLTRRGELVKLATYRMGPVGAREHVWSLPVSGVAA
jgi:hypothetical protein